MGKREFPITVRRGNVRVKIYKTPTHGCTSYTVVYYQGGGRVRRTFSELALAEQEAEVAANKICSGELDVLTLTSADRTAYVRSMELLRETGTPLEIAVMQYSEAAKILKGASLVEAAKFFAKHHSKEVKLRNVPEIVTEFIATKESEGHSAAHVRDLKGRLVPFGKHFASPISMILCTEMQDYLRDLKYGARSKNNTIKAIRSLFRFAQVRKYLPKGWTEAHDLRRFKEPIKAIGIFTPAELAKIVAQAREELIPFLTIGAFAGLRSAEIMRLDWSEIDMEGRFIEVKAGKAKTRNRRLVPISDNLKRWIAPRLQKEGLIIQQSASWLNKEVRKLVATEGVKVKWQRNGLRHSYISYRVAEIQDVAQVALEAGNSPKIIFSNYRELVKPKQADQWFSIVPPGVIEEKPEPAVNGKPDEPKVAIVLPAVAA